MSNLIGKDNLLQLYSELQLNYVLLKVDEGWVRESTLTEDLVEFIHLLVG
jgi:hypothetical protein